jgi:hypothetical protein
VWILQHCFKPDEDIARIRRSVIADDNAFVLNMPRRAVPAVLNDTNRFTLAHDGIDVAALLRTEFNVWAKGIPDKSRMLTSADEDVYYWIALRQHES